MSSLSLHALDNIPHIEPGDDLANVVIGAAANTGVAIEDGDVVVLAQKIVSKSENRYVDLCHVDPSPEAKRLAAICKKDPRLVELILRESAAVLRCVPNIIVVRHKLGLVLANAGIDQSNLPDNIASERVLLLPIDPDASAGKIRAALAEKCGCTVGVAIIDSLGRAWRIGTTGTCIGASGFKPVRDMRGSRDLYGRTLQSTVIGIGDELAAAASLVMGQAAEGTPIVLIKGIPMSPGDGAARDLVRPMQEDLFP